MVRAQTIQPYTLTKTKKIMMQFYYHPILGLNYYWQPIPKGIKFNRKQSKYI